MSRGTFTTSFITKVQDQFIRLLLTARDDVRRHMGNRGVGTQLDHFHVAIIFVFILYSFHSFDDFLLLGSLSPYTKTSIYRQTSIQIYFEVQTFCFSVLSAKVPND